MRIALIHIAQETNDFNPSSTTMEDYRAFGIIEGQEVLKEHADVGSIRDRKSVV